MSAVAEIPIINLDKEKFFLDVTVVNLGERQFSIGTIGIWLHARNSVGQIFDISLTEIGKSKLEDGDKIRKSLNVSSYLNGLGSYQNRCFTKFDRWLPNRVEMYFMTTTKKKIPVSLSGNTKQKIIARIMRDYNSDQQISDTTDD